MGNLLTNKKNSYMINVILDAGVELRSKKRKTIYQVSTEFNINKEKVNVMMKQKRIDTNKKYYFSYLGYFYSVGIFCCNKHLEL